MNDVVETLTDSRIQIGSVLIQCFCSCDCRSVYKEDSEQQVAYPARCRAAVNAWRYVTAIDGIYAQKKGSCGMHLLSYPVHERFAVILTYWLSNRF